MRFLLCIVLNLNKNIIISETSLCNCWVAITRDLHRKRWPESDFGCPRHVLYTSITIIASLHQGVMIEDSYKLFPQCVELQNDHSIMMVEVCHKNFFRSCTIMYIDKVQVYAVIIKIQSPYQENGLKMVGRLFQSGFMRYDSVFFFLFGCPVCLNFLNSSSYIDCKIFYK